MAHFIKTGYWESSALGYKGWLNIEDVVNGVITNSLGGKTINLVDGGLTLNGGPITNSSAYGTNSYIVYDNIYTTHTNGKHDYVKYSDMWDYFQTNPFVSFYTVFNNSADRLFDANFLEYSPVSSTADFPINHNITIKYADIRLAGNISNIMVSGGNKTLAINNLFGGGSINALSNYSAKLSITTNGANINHVASYTVNPDAQVDQCAITITNRYGLLINDFNAIPNGFVTYTNKWGVYQMGNSTNNYFQGKMLIGTSTPGNSKVRISGLPTSSAGLVSGELWNDAGTVKIIP